MSKLSVASVSWIIGVLQQSWHVRAATQEDFDLGGVLGTPSLNFQGENPLVVPGSGGHFVSLLKALSVVFKISSK
jgi:hypothetical protein